MCCKIHRFQLNFQFLFLIKDYYRLYSFACDLTSKAKHQHLGLGIVREHPILTLDVDENTCRNKKKVNVINCKEKFILKPPLIKLCLTKNLSPTESFMISDFSLFHHKNGLEWVTCFCWAKFVKNNRKERCYSDNSLRFKGDFFLLLFFTYFT